MMMNSKALTVENNCFVRWLPSSAHRWSFQTSILCHPQARLGLLLDSLAVLWPQVSLALVFFILSCEEMNKR